MVLKLKLEGIARFLAIVGIILLILNTAGYLAHFTLGYKSFLIDIFSFGAEHNIPTFYGSMLWLSSAVLSLVIAVFGIQNKKKYAKHWTFLSAIFVYCSLDEMLMFHERLIKPLRSRLHTQGLLYYAWIIPFGILLVFFVMAYWGFLKSLPGRSRSLLVAAGAIYVLGAIGLEMLGGRWYSLHGGQNLAYRMYQTVEESLEIGGLSLSVYAIADYVKTSMGSVTIEF